MINITVIEAFAGTDVDAMLQVGECPEAVADALVDCLGPAIDYSEADTIEAIASYIAENIYGDASEIGRIL